VFIHSKGIIYSDLATH
jgi:serine/threonine protein kinase